MEIIQLIAVVFMALAPAIVIAFNLLRNRGYCKSKEREKIESSWRNALKNRKLAKTDQNFEKIYELLKEEIDRDPEKDPDFLKIIFSGPAGTRIMLSYEDKNGEENKDRRERFIPIQLAQKAITEYGESLDKEIAKKWYMVAAFSLFAGFFLELVVRLRALCG